MGDVLMRGGFPPVVFQQLDRAEYFEAIVDAQKGDISKLYGWIMEELYNMLIARSGY